MARLFQALGWSLAVYCGALLIGPASAQQPDFKGKTITIDVGSSPGGGLDLYGRLVSRYLGRHVPGTPSVVVANMPGAGGNVAAIHLYTIAPKTGIEMAIVFPSVLVDPLLNEAMRKDYDPTRFSYVGNANGEKLVCMLRKDAPVATPADLLNTEVLIGATAAGSTTFDYPTVINGIAGTKMKIVSGYKGSRDVTLAAERGEVQGICGIGWSTVKIQYPDILSGKLFGRIFAQEDLTGHPELNAAKVPLMTSLAKTDDDVKTLETFYAQNAFSRPFILPPGIDPAILATMRKAFLDTMHDPDLLADAAKMNVDVEPSSGEEVQGLIQKMYQTPKPIIERIKKALGRDK